MNFSLLKRYCSVNEKFSHSPGKNICKNNPIFKKMSTMGAPGWLRQLSGYLWLRSWSQSPGTGLHRARAPCSVGSLLLCFFLFLCTSPLVNWQINWWYIHTMKCSSAIKRNKLEHSTWKNFKSILLSEKHKRSKILRLQLYEIPEKIK